MIFERGSEGESVAYLPVLNVSDVQGACPQEAHDGEDAGCCTGIPSGIGCLDPAGCRFVPSAYGRKRRNGV